MKPAFLVLFLASCLASTWLHADGIVELPGYVFKYSVETTVDKAVIWQLWKDVDNWKQFDKRLEYSYLKKGYTFENGAQGYLKSKGAPRTKFKLLNIKPGESFEEKLYLPLMQSILLKRYVEETPEGKTVFTHEVHLKGWLKPVFNLFLSKPFRKDIVLVMQEMKALAESDANKKESFPFTSDSN